MDNYFKSEQDKLEFILIYIDGARRSEFLKITRPLYSSKIKAKVWYDDIKSKITDTKAIAKLDELYGYMVIW